jgi:hypothetical protein
MEVIMKTNLLKDLLYNAHPDSGASDDYVQGIIVASVSTIMALQDCTFEDAYNIVFSCLPMHCRDNILPDSWFA